MSKSQTRISMITLENFKGISEPVEIPLRPITLLFGKNSAGKSTILQAMLYGRHILHNGQIDVDSIELGGKYIDLGGFKNFVHLHETQRVVRIRFDVELDFNGLLGFDEEKMFFVDGCAELDNVLGNVKSAYVEFIIQLDSNNDVSKKCNIGIDHEPAATIKWEEGECIYSLHPYLNDLKEQIGLDIDLPWGFSSPDLIPSIGHFFIFNMDDVSKYDESRYDVSAEFFLNRCIMRPLTILKEQLDSLRYIGPIREIPPRDMKPCYTQDNERWASGLAAWDVLMNPNLNYVATFQKINAALKELKLDYEVHRRHSIALEPMNKKNFEESLFFARHLVKMDEEARKKNEAPQMDEETLKNSLGDLHELKDKIQLFLKENTKNIEVAPCDIGVGISQVLPVVVGAIAKDPNTGKRPSILAIEQPELHVHPAVQCELGDLFIREHKSQMFLIETHSEHLILRILRRILETTQNTLEDTSTALTPDDLAILIVTQEGSTVKIERMAVDKNGEILTQWPGGFFEERYTELFGA